MKLFSDKRMRLILLVFIIAGAEAIGTGGTLGTIAVFCEALAFLWLIGTLFSMLKSRKQKYDFSLGAVLSKMVMRVFEPMIKRIRRKNDRNTRFIYGEDKIETIRKQKISVENKKRIRKRKIDIDRETENREKVRLSYIKYVIEAAESGQNITYADTPLEIMKVNDKKNSAKLFELYSCGRYDKEHWISDKDAELCKNIADRKTE